MSIPAMSEADVPVMVTWPTLPPVQRDWVVGARTINQKLAVAKIWVKEGNPDAVVRVINRSCNEFQIEDGVELGTTGVVPGTTVNQGGFTCHPIVKRLVACPVDARWESIREEAFVERPPTAETEEFMRAIYSTLGTPSRRKEMSDLAAESSIDLLDPSSSRGDSSIPCYQLAVVRNECLLGIQSAKVEEIEIEKCQSACLMVTKQEVRPGNNCTDDNSPQGKEEEHQFSDAKNGVELPPNDLPDDLSSTSPNGLVTSLDLEEMSDKGRPPDQSSYESTSCEVVNDEEQEQNREELLYKRDPQDNEEVRHTPDLEKVLIADVDSPKGLQTSLDYKGRPLARAHYEEMSRAFLRGRSPYDDPVDKGTPEVIEEDFVSMIKSTDVAPNNKVKETKIEFVPPGWKTRRYKETKVEYQRGKVLSHEAKKAVNRPLFKREGETSPRKQSVKAKWKEKGACHHCQEYGHFIKQCPARKIWQELREKDLQPSSTVTQEEKKSEDRKWDDVVFPTPPIRQEEE